MRCDAAVGVESGHQAPLAVLDQGSQDRLDLRGRLALAEDHLGEPAPRSTLQVDVREAPRFDEALGTNPRAASAGVIEPEATASNN